MKKITSLKRRIIIALVFIFVLGFVSPIVVFYSLGYRFDWNKKIFVHSGSIVFKSTPESVEVRIDGKVVSNKSMDLINRSVNINGLTPRKYLFEVSNPDFKPWKKEAEVHSGIATEFWNIVLVPRQPQKDVLFEGNILSYAFSPDKKKVAFFEKKEEQISLFVRENGKDVLVYGEPINQRIVPQEGELKWSKDAKWLIFSFKQEDKEKVFLAGSVDNYLNIIPLGKIWQRNLLEENREPEIVADNSNQNKKNKNLKEEKTTQKKEETSPKIEEDGIETYYSWDDRGNIYFMLNGKIYFQSVMDIYEWWKKQSEQEKDEEVVASAAENEENKNGNSLKKDNLNLNLNVNVVEKEAKEKISSEERAFPKKVQEDLSGFTFCDNYICAVNVKDFNLEIIGENGDVFETVPFPQKFELRKDYKIFAYGKEEIAVLDGDGNLFLWDKKKADEEGIKELKFISPSVEEVYFSDDGKKLLYSTDNEVYVYFLRDWDVQPKHLAGSRELIWESKEKIELVNWYFDYQNIFVVLKDKVYFVELDSRGGRNADTFFEGFGIYNFSYDTGEKKMWFLEGEKGATSKLEEVTFPSSTGLFQSFIGEQGNKSK